MFGRPLRPGVEGDADSDSKVVAMTDEPKAQILVVDDEQMLLDMVSDALSFADTTSRSRPMASRL